TGVRTKISCHPLASCYTGFAIGELCSHQGWPFHREAPLRGKFRFWKDGARRVSGRLPDLLSAIKQAMDEGIGACESRLESLASELRSILADLERERAEVQAAIEERELERRLGVESAQRPPSTAELRQHEDFVAQEYMRAAVLYRQLTDFLGLLASSRQQFRADETLLGRDDAQQLAIRQAMIRAQEVERQRRAREGHDGPAQARA